MQCLLTLYVGNDMLLELQDLTDAITGEAQTTATVTATLQDAAGVDVTGQSWPATMAHVGATPGTYRATLEADLEITASARYTAIIEVDSAGVLARWDVPVVARARIR